jgi:hypothetical protein
VNCGSRFWLRELAIDGSYTLKEGKLTYRTTSSEHASAAKHACRAKRTDFKVTAPSPEQIEFNGRVLSVKLVGGVPGGWEIVVLIRPEDSRFSSSKTDLTHRGERPRRA